MPEACSSKSAGRRFNIVPNAFAEKAVLKRMLSGFISAAARQSAIKVTEFEHRRMEDLR